MATFKYRGCDNAGKQTSGTVNSDGLQAAIALLKDRGLFLSEITEVKTKAAAAASGKSAAKSKGKSSGLTIGTPTINTKNLAIITRQLSTLLGAGLPLLRSLRTIREQQTGSPAMVISDLANEVEQGAMLSQAMAKHPKSFPRIYIAMIRAGETSGALDAVLNRLAEFAEAEIRLRGKVKSAMAYPAVIVVVAIGIVSFIMLKIVPVFIEIFADFEAGALPGATQALIFLSTFLTERLWLGILILVSIIITYRILTRIPVTKYYIDTFKIKVPIFGPVVYKTIMARFSRTLSTLIASGVPILSSFEIVRETVGNLVVSRAIGDVHDAVREGSGISNPMIRTRVFPAMLTNMVGVGEETGALDNMLDKVAEAYEEEVDRAVEALASMIEPILIVFMGVVVGFIVIALFMPLIQLAMGVSG